MTQDVQTSDIRKGDMVLYRGHWFIVTNISNYYGHCGMVDDIQLYFGDNRFDWIPVTELRDVERRS